MNVLVQAAVTKYCRLCGLNNRHVFSQFWRLGNPRSRHQQNCCLEMALLLVHRWPDSSVSSPCPHRGSFLGVSYKATNPFIRAQPTYLDPWNVSQLCPTLCDPTDCSLPGSSVHGIFQAIVLEWIAISFSSGSSQPRDQTRVSRIVDRRFTV